MFSLPVSFWQTGAPWGLVGLFVIFILLGRLRTRSELKDRLAEREGDWVARLAESKGHADEWRTQAQSLMQLSDRRSDEMDKLLESNRILEGLLRAVNERLQIQRGAS